MLKNKHYWNNFYLLFRWRYILMILVRYLMLSQGITKIFLHQQTVFVFIGYLYSTQNMSVLRRWTDGISKMKNMFMIVIFFPNYSVNILIQQ